MEAELGLKLKSISVSCKTFLCVGKVRIFIGQDHTNNNLFNFLKKPVLSDTSQTLKLSAEKTKGIRCAETEQQQQQKTAECDGQVTSYLSSGRLSRDFVCCFYRPIDWMCERRGGFAYINGVGDLLRVWRWRWHFGCLDLLLFFLISPDFQGFKRNK